MMCLFGAVSVLQIGFLWGYRSCPPIRPSICPHFICRALGALLCCPLRSFFFRFILVLFPYAVLFYFFPIFAALAARQGTVVSARACVRDTRVR